IHGFWFTMHEKNAWGAVEMTNPLYQLILSGMRGKTTQSGDFCLDHKFITKHFYAFDTVYQNTPQGTFCLETGKNNGVALIPDAMFEMMADTPPCAHTATGNDYRTFLDFVDGHGFFGCDSKMQLG